MARPRAASESWRELIEARTAEKAATATVTAKPASTLFELRVDPLLSRKLSHFRTSSGMSNSGILRVLIEWCRPSLDELYRKTEPYTGNLEDVIGGEPFEVDEFCHDTLWKWGERVGMTPSRLFAALWNNFGGMVRSTSPSKVPAATITAIRVRLSRRA